MADPLWIDNSTFNATASCDTRALLRYVHGWTSQDDSLALRAGTAIHTCLEVYFKTGDRKEALKAFRANYEEWAAANVPIDGWPVKYAFENIRDILKTWMRRHPLEQEPYKVFPDLVEVGFSFILDEAEQIYFYGRYDAIVEEKASGQLYVLDHKSTGQITSDWAHAFKLSTQMTGYVWAAQQLLGGKRVSGAIINGIQVSKLPDIKHKLNGEVYKCREHGVGIDECRLTHTKESLAITQRDPHEIDVWKRDAVRLAKKYRRLAAKYPTVESVSEAPQQGKFSGACRFCDFKAYCEVGRPAEIIGTMLKNEPWRAYEVRAAAKEAGNWERK